MSINSIKIEIKTIIDEIELSLKHRKYNNNSFDFILQVSWNSIIIRIVVLSAIQIIFQYILMILKFRTFQVSQIPGIVLLNLLRVLIFLPVAILYFLFVIKGIKDLTKISLYYSPLYVFIYALIPNLIQILFLLTENYFFYFCSLFIILLFSLYLFFFNAWRTIRKFWQKCLSQILIIIYLILLSWMSNIIFKNSYFNDYKELMIIYDPISEEFVNDVMNKLELQQLIEIIIDLNKATQDLLMGDVKTANLEIVDFEKNFYNLKSYYKLLDETKNNLNFEINIKIYENYDNIILNIEKSLIVINSIRDMPDYNIQEMIQEINKGSDKLNEYIEFISKAKEGKISKEYYEEILDYIEATKEKHEELDKISENLNEIQKKVSRFIDIMNDNIVNINNIISIENNHIARMNKIKKFIIF